MYRRESSTAEPRVRFSSHKINAALVPTKFDSRGARGFPPLRQLMLRVTWDEPSGVLLDCQLNFVTGEATADIPDVRQGNTLCGDSS